MNKYISIIFFNVVFMTSFLHGVTADQIRVTCPSTFDTASSTQVCSSPDCGLVTDENLRNSVGDQFDKICNACRSWFKSTYKTGLFNLCKKHLR